MAEGSVALTGANVIGADVITGDRLDGIGTVVGANEIGDDVRKGGAVGATG